MKISFKDLMLAFSYALDCVERDVTGVSNHHGKRVAYVALLMGRKMGMSEDDLLQLACFSVLHDNALAETIRKVQQELEEKCSETKDQIKAKNIREILENPSMANGDVFEYLNQAEGEYQYHPVNFELIEQMETKRLILEGMEENRNAEVKDSSAAEENKSKSTEEEAGSAVAESRSTAEEFGEDNSVENNSEDEEIDDFIEEIRKKEQLFKMTGVGRHCVLGEENLKLLPFLNRKERAILYHHENADGSGPFGKAGDEIPLFAQLIHLADMVDSVWNMGDLTEEKIEKIRQWVVSQQGILFTKKSVELFLQLEMQQLLSKMEGDNLERELKLLIPKEKEEYTNREIRSIATMFAKIIDYKSQFTRSHSLGVASKAERMGVYYGFSKEKIIRFYLAGALHDIGKLVIDTDILEKPDKLTDEEYLQIQNHAFYTYEILRKIHGLEDITKWAAHHHEKLNGRGYPFGKKAKDLGFEERLMGCIDIYQALTENRPYKEGFSHEKTMKMLRDMGKGGFIDCEIVEDMDAAFGKGIREKGKAE